MDKVLCSVATRGRYFSTLPLVLSAIMNQTKSPDKLVIFDDNDEPKDMRSEFIYQHFFRILDSKGIKWEWLFAEKRGQHHIHQKANEMAQREGYTWVWRCDDDCVPEADVLENLYLHCNYNVGAVGGSCLADYPMDTSQSTGKIENINSEPNLQWGYITETKEVEHLHCSFLYRAGINDFNLGLSRFAHREESLFTYGIYQKGYKVLAVPNALSWHLRNPEGGIRSDQDKQEMFYHDDRIFQNFLSFKNNTIVVLNCGLGDHIVFSHILKDLKNPIVFTCYPEIIQGKSIAKAQQLFGNIDQWNIYKKMDLWQWTGSLEDAYRKLYL